jgi:hypothetical protein
LRKNPGRDALWGVGCAKTAFEAGQQIHFVTIVGFAAQIIDNLVGRKSESPATAVKGVAGGLDAEVIRQ